LKEKHIDNVLALRGDRGKDSSLTDFKYASELISLVRQGWEFHISAACYPEGHPESSDKIEDIKYLKKKVDAGASHLVSQLFFNNDDFYSFMDNVRSAGITVPIGAGIMPVVNKNQIGRIVALCGASLPSKFSRMISRFENDPGALEDAGIAYATEQIADLISSGVQEIHLYTMNNPAVAEKITRNIEGMLKSVNNG
jgi:methylenetetrahydrofolate reductase (NADPH)